MSSRGDSNTAVVVGKAEVRRTPGANIWEVCIYLDFDSRAGTISYRYKRTYGIHENGIKFAYYSSRSAARFFVGRAVAFLRKEVKLRGGIFHQGNKGDRVSVFPEKGVIERCSRRSRYWHCA